MICGCGIIHDFHFAYGQKLSSVPLSNIIPDYLFDSLVRHNINKPMNPGQFITKKHNKYLDKYIQGVIDADTSRKMKLAEKNQNQYLNYLSNKYYISLHGESVLYH